MKKTILTDPLTMKGWPDVFSTTDKSVVEKELQTTNMSYKWTVSDYILLYTDMYNWLIIIYITGW